MNTNAILAMWKRQLGQLLGNPLGYFYILAFVVVGAGMLYLPNAFFTRNIADFGPLLAYMPWMLAVLLPAMAMGSWALERELGTEEQLLTLPMSVLDVLIGKWLGVVSFFTIALFFTVWEVAILAMLGNPDYGLLFANYAGWWFLGLALAAAGVFASTLVSLPAIAFVLGALLSVIVVFVVRGFDWMDPFNRGLLPIGGIARFLVIACVFLGLAALLLSSRRWQKARRGLIVAQAIFVGGMAVTLVNLSTLADRRAADIDVSCEGLSSLSPATVEVLKGIKQPVEIAAFINQELPPELANKAKEVENVLKVIARAMGDKVRLALYRPADPLDEAGTKATKHYNLKPRMETIETVSGKEEMEVFLGAAVICGKRIQLINHFDPGLSVEYELALAIRTVASPKKKVLGILSTDLKIMGAFDPQTMQPRPGWQVIDEWKKQYDVREVNLDVEIGKDVDVLVAPQPSSLDEEKLQRLHDYIWAGRPCLIMEDPVPMFSGPDLGTAQPKRPPRQNQMMGYQPPGNKADFQPFLRALGISVDGSKTCWSDFNPSHEFRERMPKGFIWTFRNREGIKDDPVTTGISSLLLPYPGSIREAPDKSSELKVKTLIEPIAGSKWGENQYSELFKQDFFGMRPVPPSEIRYRAGSGATPALAVAISGRMQRAYPFPQKESKPDGEEKKDAASKDDKNGLGKLSEKPINVIYVADTDFANDAFFHFYRNEDNQFSSDSMKFLQDLRNVQFLSNAVDALVADQDFLALRNKRPVRRPLKAIEDVLVKAQGSFQESAEKAQTDAQKEIDKLNADFQKRLDQIESRTDLNDKDKEQLKAQVEGSARRELEANIQEINERTSLKMKEDRVNRKRTIESSQMNYRLGAFTVPSLILLLLALGIFLTKVHGERLTVPESRKRGSK